MVFRLTTDKINARVLKVSDENPAFILHPLSYISLTFKCITLFHQTPNKPDVHNPPTSMLLTFTVAMAVRFPFPGIIGADRIRLSVFVFYLFRQFLPDHVPEILICLLSITDNCYIYRFSLILSEFLPYAKDQRFSCDA